MFKGKSTTELYEECLKAGFCENHLRDLEITELESYEVQRKAILFLRLQIFGPIAFRKPFSIDKMKVLFSKSNYFIDRNDPNHGEDFKVTVLYLDAIVTFTICHFCKICCVGALFRPNRPDFKIISKEDTIWRILDKKKLEESDISYLVPSLKENFEGDDENFYKLCYVATLLLVRNVSLSLNLKTVIAQQDKEFNNIPEECKSWNDIGLDAFHQKQYVEAENAYDCGLKYSPYFLPLLINRAELFIDMDRFKEAALDSYVALMISPTSNAFCKYTTSLHHMSLFSECLKAAMYGMRKCRNLPDVHEDYIYLDEMRNAAEFSLKLLNEPDPEVDEKENMQEVPDVQKKLKSPRSKAKLTEENKDIPELIEASDSESDIEDVPEAMDASDSESCSESESSNVTSSALQNCITTVENIQRQETSIENIQSKETSIENIQSKETPSPSKKEEEEKVEHLKSILKEASVALSEGCGLLALRRYRESLDEIKASPEIYNYEECDIICIKYAFGVAYCKSGGYDDLQKAIAVFKGITENHFSIHFPAAYYGMALAYRKLNRFKEAIHYLQIVEDILQKGIQMKVYPWPESTDVIEETKSENLKMLVCDLLKECESPPSPDATCRFQECSLTPAIYYTDPDFKGFFSIQCSDQCCLQFHPVCWRLLKTAKHFTDKEFLDQMCITPDCEGVIIKIENIDKEGIVSKVFESADFKKTTKKKTKLEKKLEVKEEKRRKRKDSSSKNDENKNETAMESTNEIQPAATSDYNKSDAKSETKTEIKEKVEEASIPTDSQIPATTGSFIVWKKEKIVNENVNKCNSKAKEHKKSKNTISIDEFLERPDIYGNEYQQRLNVLRQNNQNITEGHWTNHNTKSSAPKFEPPRVFNNPEVESSYGLDNFSVELPSAPVASFSEAIKEGARSLSPPLHLPTQFSIECAKKNTYSYLKNILSRFGPLREDDPILIAELQTFPGESNAMIADCGGIGKFLQQSVEFAFVGETYVCLVDQLPLAYKKISSANVPFSTSEFSDNPHSLENFTLSVGTLDSNVNSLQYSLNPDAQEYNPGKLVRRNSAQLISTISKLRQPLTVDEESTNGHIEVTASSYVNPGSNRVSSIPNDSSYAVGVNGIDTNSLPKQMELVRMCLEAARVYFSDEMNEYRNYVDGCLHPYSIVKLGKKISRCIQTESMEVGGESKGTMKTDDELERLREVVSCLTEENVYLKEQTALLGEQCNSALDNATRCQKKSSVELMHLKKELEDAIAASEEQAKEAKSRESKLEKEIKFLSESLKKSKEEQLAQKIEMEDLQSQNESLKHNLTVLEQHVNTARNQKHIIQTTLGLQLDKLKDDIKTLESDKLDAIKRAQVTELKLLNVQKDEFIKRIEDKMLEASQKMKELKDGIASTSLNTVFAKSFGALLTQIQNYVGKLSVIRIDFLTQIDEHINAVKNGTPLETLEPLEMKELPQIPSWNNQMPKQNGNANPPPHWVAQAQQMMTNPGMNPAAANAFCRQPMNAFPPNFPGMIGNQQALLQQLQSMNLSNNTGAIPKSGSNQTVPISSASQQSIPVKKLPPGLQDPCQSLTSKTPSDVLQSAVTAKPSTAATQPPSPLRQPSAAAAASQPPTALRQPFATASQPPSVQKQPSAVVTQPTTSAMQPPSVSSPQSKAAVSKMKAAVSNSSLAQSESATSLKSSAASSLLDVKKSCDSISAQALELDYNVKKSPPKQTSVPESSTASSSKSTESRPTSKNSYEKLISRLKNKYPEATQAQLAAFVKDFRQQKNSLSGLSMDMIISQIVAMVEAKKQAGNAVSESVTRNRSIQNKVLVNKKLSLDESAQKTSDNTSQSKKSAWGIRGDSSKQWQGKDIDEGCTICFEEMNHQTAYTVDCGHVFHLKCIKEWLNKKSDCPICRVHLLLPEDYPAL